MTMQLIRNRLNKGGIANQMSRRTLHDLGCPFCQEGVLPIMDLVLVRNGSSIDKVWGFPGSKKGIRVLLPTSAKKNKGTR